MSKLLEKITEGKLNKLWFVPFSVNFQLIFILSSFASAIKRGLVISTHAASTLDSFCKWTTGQNNADDKSPDHFDHAALFSK